MPDKVEKAYLTPTEAATFFNVTKKTIKRWDEAGKFPNAIGEGRERRYPIADIENFNKSKTPEKEKSSESEEVKTAKESRAVADERAAEATAKAIEAEQKARANAFTLGFQTVEAYLEAQQELVNNRRDQDAIIAEAVKEEKGRLEEATQRHNEESNALHARVQEIGTELLELRELCGAQKQRIEEQDKLLGVKKEKERKLASDTDYYNDHVVQGTRQLNRIAKNIAPYHRGLADYLHRQVKGLENGVGYEQGMSIFKACSRNIVKVGSWFFEEAERDKKLDAHYTYLGDYLLNDADEPLKVLMRIPWKTDKSTKL